MATTKDIVLIYLEDNPLVFARIEDILPDSKPDWYHVKLLFLQVPLQVVTWILRDVYIEGAEFTMSGKRLRLEKVICPETPERGDKPVTDSETGKKTPISPNGAKVISLIDLKKH